MIKQFDNNDYSLGITVDGIESSRAYKGKGFRAVVFTRFQR